MIETAVAAALVIPIAIPAVIATAHARWIARRTSR
jgi:hypothetical protein